MLQTQATSRRRATGAKVMQTDSQLEVISITEAEFWEMNREAHALARAAVRSGQIEQQSLYLLKSADLREAVIKWPNRRLSVRGLSRRE